nr:EOG090X0ARU [Eulimnadia texana]
MGSRKIKTLPRNANCRPFTNNVRKRRKSPIKWLTTNRIYLLFMFTRNGLNSVHKKSWFHRDIKTLKKDLVTHSLHLTLRKEALDWLLGFAIHLEISDNPECYNASNVKQKTENKGLANVDSSNPLDTLDFESAEFKAGVNTLADLFKVAKHPDHLITLEAINVLVQEKLAGNGAEDLTATESDATPFAFEEAPLGFDTKDSALNQASRILRLLFISDLRNLQTRINEAIVGVQALTANPKTDTRAGKVGR